MLDVAKFEIVDQFKVCKEWQINDTEAGRFDELHLWFSKHHNLWFVDLTEGDYIALQQCFTDEKGARDLIRNCGVNI